MKTLHHKVRQAFLCAFALAIACPCVAEEMQTQLFTAVSSTTLDGYVDSSPHWNAGLDVQAVPEPSTLALLTVGGVAFGFVVRRQKKER